MEHEELTRIIIGRAIRVHRALGPGFLESVYRNALAHELNKAGLEVHCEKRIQVRYDGALVGDFFADMMIQNCVLIENKAVQALNKAHEVQLVNYLVACAVLRHGLPVGANPTRQLSFQPVAIGAAAEVTKRSEHFDVEGHGR